MKLQSVALAIFISSAALAQGAAAAVSYSLSSLGLLTAGGSSQASAINNLGQVVGNATVLDPRGEGGPSYVSRAFLYSQGAMHDLGTLVGDATGAYGLPYSTARAINDAGQVVGGSAADGIFSAAFLYQDGRMQQLPAVSDTPFANFASGINNAGVVVGEEGYRSQRYAFIYANGVTVDLPELKPGQPYSAATAINNLGQVVGSSTDSYFLYDNGVLTDIGVVGGVPTGINDLGQIVGKSGLRNAPTGLAYLYADGVRTELGTLAGGVSIANDINNLGQIVGSSDGRGFLWAGGIMTDLNLLIDPAAGWTITEAAGINELGQIAATACNAAGCRAVRLDLIAAVPEPSTTAMLLGGLALAGWAARRQKSRARAGAGDTSTGGWRGQIRQG